MSTEAAVQSTQVREFVVKGPGFNVSGFERTSHWQSRICLATNEQILFDLIYGSEIRAEGYENQYPAVRHQVLARPDLIEEIFALLKAHRESKEHKKLFPGFDSLEKFENILIEFGKKYPAKSNQIVEKFVDIMVPDSGEVMDVHYFEVTVRAIRELNYCPASYLNNLIEKFHFKNLCHDLHVKISRALAHAGPAGVNELLKTMIQHPKCNWSWALMELSVVYKDFSDRFEELMPVALEQAVYSIIDRQPAYRPISASLFGSKLHEKLFERWQSAKQEPQGPQPSAIRDGVCFTLAACGNLPQLIEKFGKETKLILTIFGAIEHLINRAPDSHPGNPFMALNSRSESTT